MFILLYCGSTRKRTSEFSTTTWIYQISSRLYLSAVTCEGSLCFLILNLFLHFNLQLEEVYNFSQDDLLTEDILILDTHAEVFIWIGQCVDPKEKQNAFEIGQVNMLNINAFVSNILSYLKYLIYPIKFVSEIHRYRCISGGAVSTCTII